MKRIELWSNKMPAGNGNDFRPYLEFFSASVSEPTGVVVIFPGGGYSHRAEHEGKPVAEFFNRNGLHAAVVQYRVTPNKYPAALLDAARAIRLIRKQAAQWQVIPDRIAVCGFSAGGHLAGSIGLLHNQAGPAEDDLVSLSAGPNAMILCYPVICSGPFGHQGSFNNLVGDDRPLRDYLSLEKQVTADSPPAFLWHTADDASVPVENSLMFAQALSKAKVTFEMHIFPHGSHGLGLAPDNATVAAWSKMAAAWLKNIGWHPKTK